MLTTVYYPQFNSQTERTNQEIEQHLWLFTWLCYDDWVTYLLTAEFVLNSHLHLAYQMTPFEVMYGYHPDFTIPPGPFTKFPALYSCLCKLHKMRKDVEATLCLQKQTLTLRQVNPHLTHLFQVRKSGSIWKILPSCCQHPANCPHTNLAPIKLSNVLASLPTTYNSHPQYTNTWSSMSTISLPRLATISIVNIYLYHHLSISIKNLNTKSNRFWIAANITTSINTLFTGKAMMLDLIVGNWLLTLPTTQISLMHSMLLIHPRCAVCPPLPLLHYPSKLVIPLPQPCPALTGNLVPSSGIRPLGHWPLVGG